MSLKILERFIRSPNFNDFTVLVVPDIGQVKKSSEPIKSLTGLTYELENVIFLVRRDI
jgi:hypothetical protein